MAGGRNRRVAGIAERSGDLGDERGFDQRFVALHVDDDRIVNATEFCRDFGYAVGAGFDLSLAVSTQSTLMTDLLPSGYFDPPQRVIIVATMAGSAPSITTVSELRNST